MKVKILNNISYQTFPITDNMIEFDDEDLKEIGKTKQFYQNTIIDYVNPITEINKLKNWFNGYYTIHEQKYRRLIAIDKLCDDGASPSDKLSELYALAEVNRKKIQELEEVINGKNV